MDSDNPHTSSLILASGSPTRARMLRDAGLAAEAVAPGVDEEAVKRALAAEHAPAEHVALTLAELKAVRVSQRRPGALVIGADQTLVCNGVLFDKPPDLAHARAQLQALRGKPHELISAAVAARDGAALWRETQRARLVMRAFSDAFLDRYLEQVGEDALGSVSAYRIEGPGAQLFARVDGDLFTILGLPLLPLLEFLRGHGVVPR
jgi:septum formation protein